MEVVRTGQVRFHPERWGRVYLDWLENIRPWCISRQLWWGHRLPVWYCDACEETFVAARAARALRHLRRRAAARRGRARHVVLVGAVAVRDARLARRHAGAARVLPDGRAGHRARHHLPVGRADGDDGHGVHARRPVHGRRHHLDHPGARRPPHVEVARHRHRPARRDRGPRRGRGPVRAARDVVVAGRALLGREDPAGPAAREQDVERLAARAAERGRRRARAAAAHRRGPLDPVAPAARDRGAGASRSRPTTSRTRRSTSTRSSTATSATGTWRWSSRACTSRRRRSPRRCCTCSARRSRSPIRCCRS